MKRLAYVAGLGVVLTLWGTGAASAGQDDEPLEKGYSLGEVVVSAPGGGVEAIGTVRTLTAEDIAAGGARTLDEAIALVPGLYVRMANAGTPRIDIRGFRTRHVRLLVDGIPVNDTYDGQFDPTAIPVDHIARIKVTTGGGSVLYGPGGNGGIINIITRNGTADLGGSLSAEAASGDTYSGRMNLSASSDRTNLFVSASPYRQDGYPLSDDFAATADEDGGRRENSDRTRHALFGSLGHAVSEDARIGVTLNYVQGENGVPPVVNYDRDDIFTRKPKYDRTEDLQAYGGQLAFERRPDGPFSTKGWAFLSRLSQDDERYDDDGYDSQAKNGASHTRSEMQVAGASFQLRYAGADRGALTLGLTGESHTWEASGFSIGRGDVRQDFSDDRALQVYTAALQYEATPASGFSVTGGAAGHAQARSGSDNDTDVSCMFGARYALSAGLQVKGSFARKVRFPSIRQLYDAKSGNPALGTERSHHYEAGVEWASADGATALSLTGFTIDANGFIEKDENDLYRNYEEYRFRGLEAAVENRSVQGLRVRATYSLLDTENRSPGAQRDALQYRPEDTFGLRAVYRLPVGLTASGSVRRVADQVLYDSDGEPPLEQKALGNYTLADVRLSQDIRGTGLRAYLGVSNLLDENYQQSYGLPQPGRSLYVGVGYRY